MKNFTFNTRTTKSIKIGLIIGVIYLSIVFTIFNIVFGGTLGMADAINSVESLKFIVFILAIIVLLPFFIILQFIHPKITVEIDSSSISSTVKNIPTKTLSLSSVYKITLNVSKINKLDIYDSTNTIVMSFEPHNKIIVLQEIIEELKRYKEFSKSTKIEKFFGSPVEKITYIEATKL